MVNQKPWKLHQLKGFYRKGIVCASKTMGKVIIIGQTMLFG